MGVRASWALVVSQVALSFGIPFAIVPLTRYTSDRELMGKYSDALPMKIVMGVISTLIICLNLALVYLTFKGVAV